MDSATNSCDPNRDRLAGVLATVGHELRTPLTSIRGYLETLLDAELDPPTTRRFLETARRETLRLGRLIDGMLEFSPLDLSVPLDFTAPLAASCDVVEQIAAAVEMLAPLAAERGVTVHASFPQTARARVDGDACVRALANLLQNAIKHGREGGRVDITCACRERHVTIVVEDDGAGIAPRDHEAIFRLGFRGTRTCSGSGIGLAVVRAIARRAGGDAFVQPSSGGARFVLSFPAG